MLCFSPGAKSPRGRAGGRPVAGQVGLGIADDFEDCAPVFAQEVRQREVGNAFASIFTGQYVVKQLIDALAHQVRHGIEGSTINHVGERVAEQASLEVEVAEGTPLSVSRTALRKGLTECGDADDRLV